MGLGVGQLEVRSASGSAGFQVLSVPGGRRAGDSDGRAEPGPEASAPAAARTAADHPVGPLVWANREPRGSGGVGL